MLNSKKDYTAQHLKYGNEKWFKHSDGKQPINRFR